MYFFEISLIFNKITSLERVRSLIAIKYLLLYLVSNIEYNFL